MVEEAIVIVFILKRFDLLLYEGIEIVEIFLEVGRDGEVHLVCHGDTVAMSGIGVSRIERIIGRKLEIEGIVAIAFNKFKELIHGDDSLPMDRLERAMAVDFQALRGKKPGVPSPVS